jgi:hypothetical protein
MCMKYGNIFWLSILVKDCFEKQNFVVLRSQNLWRVVWLVVILECDWYLKWIIDWWINCQFCNVYWWVIFWVSIITLGMVWKGMFEVDQCSQLLIGFFDSCDGELKEHVERFSPFIHNFLPPLCFLPPSRRHRKFFNQRTSIEMNMPEKYRQWKMMVCGNSHKKFSFDFSSSVYISDYPMIWQVSSVYFCDIEYHYKINFQILILLWLTDLIAYLHSARYSHDLSVNSVKKSPIFCCPMEKL